MTGQQLKLDGMLRAEQSAGKEWNENANNYALEFLNKLEKGERFMGEQLRETAEAFGLQAPKSNRIWGAVMIRLVKERKIEKVGFAKVKNPRAHQANATVWKKI